MELKKDDVINLMITGMNHEGQGVGKSDGFTIFVDGALEGESALVSIKAVKKTYAMGTAIAITKPSQERAFPFCPVYENCGGCNLQHMSYRETLRFKRNVVEESLKRIGKLDNYVLHDTIGMKEPFNYRNKVQFPYKIQGGRSVSGLYAKRSHDIIEFLECAIQMDINDKIRRIVDEYVSENGIKIYDEVSGTGHLRHLMIRAGHKSDDVMVVFVVNGRGFPGMDNLVQTLVSAVPNIKSVYINVNRKKTNIILGEENVLIYGSPEIYDYLGGFKFAISPLSFYQVNPVQTEVLYGKAIEYAGLTGAETVFDLYCGVGTISLFLSRHARMVYGVEVVRDAVIDAEKNVQMNGADNIKFVEGEAEKVIPEMYKRGIKADVVVVDPPRKGCDDVLLSTVIKMAPARIVYVSCNPSTLARDLAVLAVGGYKVKDVQPVDMFPWTKHVECVVSLSNVKNG